MSGRQLRVVQEKQRSGRDAERPGVGSQDELGSRRVEILLCLSLALGFRSASRPALPPLPEPRALHCGGCSPGVTGGRHVLLADGKRRLQRGVVSVPRPVAGVSSFHLPINPPDAVDLRPEGLKVMMKCAGVPVLPPRVLDQ
jgi:hypothetical protein